MSSPALTPAQTHALFDILIHHQLYSEIVAFKDPATIDRYGHPFKKPDGVQTTSPLLQNMLNKFVVRLPGLNNVGPGFWEEKIRMLVMKLGEAELSESYDKGAIGARKALATAISSLLEYVARGMLGGYPGGPREATEKREYDTSKADDILRAWDDGMRDVIYGDLLDELFVDIAKTGKLEDHSNIVQGAHEFILLNLASFLHHIFILSPDGQYILRIIENVHRLIPYYAVKQTLKVGNAATMINGMVKLVLTKLSITAVTNWMGWTNNSNDGMNLMQQILSTVMAWDTSEFQKRAQKLESGREVPDKKVFKAIKAYVYASREKHEAARGISMQESKSIIAVILESADPPIEPDSITEVQHQAAMEYYSNILSLRDREELTKILCKLQPDLLTSAIREVVTAFDPVIRGVHNAVDLSSTLGDLESFLTDLIKVSKQKKTNGNGTNSKTGSRNNSRSSSPAPGAPIQELGPGGIPTVEDFIQLIRKHMPSAHKFLHQIAKNAPELTTQYRDYAKACAAELRTHNPPKPSESQDPKHGDAGAGDMTDPLTSIFSSLSSAKQDQLRALLDHHERHLQYLKSTSTSRLKTLIAHTSRNTITKLKGTMHGPGMYLSRWHSLLDSTLITPATLSGPVRHGWEVKGELDGNGLKTGRVVQTSAGSRRRGSVGSAGDAQESRERKREGSEGARTERVWVEMRDGWVGVCRGLEVMGSG
ncbi:PX-associated-domain-containing protein [Clohesyomyces aquaticus]|uniref:PX-associated-domain-containing protein n=1 Tax=Clohesyomyces aquaticus TaxID=1231657 RepID=A0A1Y1ZYY5_9PLEO|nr:PX-associated-domain-containing protein [Clohesyomyces aquaticus]